jgi:SAM-dependent methyltransferase
MFERLEESCVPSYCHANPAAAGVAWLRLMVAARLWQRLGSPEPVLDFGSGTGELQHFVRAQCYAFVEQNVILAEALRDFVSGAEQLTLESLPTSHFGAVFALDSLEHNHHPETFISRLAGSLRPNGILIVSGPTENWLYRLGRRAAGYDGHYHHQTVFGIETLIAQSGLKLLVRKIVPWRVPLFHLSAWRAGA